MVGPMALKNLVEQEHPSSLFAGKKERTKRQPTFCAKGES